LQTGWAFAAEAHIRQNMTAIPGRAGPLNRHVCCNILNILQAHLGPVGL
jgi:hypothetical protein